jgi:hypothetical protein
MIITSVLYASGAFIVTGTLLRKVQWPSEWVHTRRKVTCYFVRQYNDGSVSPPQKKVLTVEQNMVATSLGGVLYKFIVPTAGSTFLYAVTSPQPLTPFPSILTAQQLHAILDSHFMDSVLRTVKRPSRLERIFGRKTVYVPVPGRVVLEDVEKSGVVEGDFIIFSRKLWEELKTK